MLNRSVIWWVFICKTWQLDQKPFCWHFLTNTWIKF